MRESSVKTSVFVSFPCGILGQVWFLIVSIPDLCTLIYFDNCPELKRCYEQASLLDQNTRLLVRDLMDFTYTLERLM